MLWCIQPIFKIVTAACLFCRPCSACTRFYKSSLLTADIRGRPFKRLRPKSCRISKSKSSNAPIRPKGLSFCRDVGSSNAPSRGLIAAAAWPKISKISPQTHSLSSASPRFVSCSESFASVNKLFGRTFIFLVLESFRGERIIEGFEPALWKMLETQVEGIARLAREDASWNRPNDEVLSDLAVRYQRPIHSFQELRRRLPCLASKQR